MPKISIVIPAYNVGPYLTECLASVAAQTYKDIEAVIVDDGSHDDTPLIAEKMAKTDKRFRIITNNPNKGTHLTRRIGVEHATGDYTFFLDGDDALKPDMCEELVREVEQNPVDILHYGLTVVSANNLLEDERQAFEQFNNADTPSSSGEGIIKDIFDEERGHIVDWRVTQRLYRTSLLKQAFSEMTTERLGRSQDGYECFVISALANTYRSYKQCRGYIYYYGRGISGTNTISAEKFGIYCHHFKADFDAANEFADRHAKETLHNCARGFQHKATEILANDWAVRLSTNDQNHAARLMSEVFGDAITARD